MQLYEPPLEVQQAYLNGWDEGTGIEDQCRKAIHNALDLAPVFGQDAGDVLQYYLSKEGTNIGLRYILAEVNEMSLFNDPSVYSKAGIGIAHAFRNFSIESDQEKVFNLIQKNGWLNDPLVREEFSLSINYQVRQRLNLWDQDKKLVSYADKAGALPT
ncbi:MAG: hypothetical protein NDI94_05625 [Candidatus Woesearchaeota archaeon]|nr:hypothetical protein [Candidatus Woesearchaeota archaeon]